MSDEHAGTPPPIDPQSVQPKTDTQRLRAVEVAMHSLTGRVDRLEAKVGNTERTYAALRVMVEGIAASQGGIRDDLGLLKAGAEGIGLLLGKVDDLGAKLDRHLKDKEKGNA